MKKNMALQGLTTRVIDVSSGAAVAGVPLRLERHSGGKWHPVAIAITDERGRAHLLDKDDEETLRKGDYRLTFEVAAYFKTREINAFFPFVQVTFCVAQIKHHHIPLLLGPFGYSVHGEV